MDLPGTPGRTGLGAAASIAPAPAAAATAKRAADHVARKEAKAKAKAAKAARAAKKAQAGDTAAAAAGTPARAAEAVVGRAGVLLGRLGTVVADATAVVGAALGAAAAMSLPLVGAAVAVGVPLEAAAVVAGFPLVGAVVVAGVAAGAVVVADVVAGARKATRKAAKLHRSSVAADCVAHMADEPSAPPDVPKRERKVGGEDLRPASRGCHPETWARNNYKKHTGLHLRVWSGGEMTAEIDHAAIPHPQCSSANCLLDCCRTCSSMGGAPGSVGRRTHEMWLRDQARKFSDCDGQNGEDAYLKSGIQTRLRRHVDGEDADHPFKRKPLDPAEGPHVQHAPRGCQYCNTCAAVPLAERGHLFKPSGPKCCPRWDEGQAYLDDHPSTAMVYTVTSATTHVRSDVLVSRSYFASLYQCGARKMARLRNARLSTDPKEHSVKSGVAGGHNKLCATLMLLLLAVLSSQPREASHYGKFDSTKTTEYFEKNVTRQSVWWEFCEQHDKEYFDQATLLGFKHSYHTK